VWPFNEFLVKKEGCGHLNGHGGKRAQFLYQNFLKMRGICLVQLKLNIPEMSVSEASSP